MSLYQKMQQALDNRNYEDAISHYHDDYVFLRHQSGTSMSRADWLPVFKQMMESPELTFHKSRCLYENDDIVVYHSVMSFPDGSSEAVLVVHMLREGKIIRTETGATPISL